MDAQMKILFEGQKFATDAHGGIVRYFAELMRNFDEKPGIKYELPITYSNNAYLRTLPRFKNKLKKILPFKEFFPSLRFRGMGRLYLLRIGAGLRSNRKEVIRAIKARDFDLFHPTYYNYYYLRALGNKPFVITVYDMIHELFMANNTHLDPTIAQKKKIIPLATRIIAISQSTKDDLVRILNVPAEKIDVIHLANSLEPTADDLKTRPAEMTKPYLLFVGSRSGYKNFNKFAKAILPLLKEKQDLQLVCVGQNDLTHEEEVIFSAENLLARVHLFTVDDHKLIQFYAHAEAFIFPSLYEGFGIPVLESFACGCPAILSNASSLPEVGGQAAAYFDPNSEQSMYEVIKKVIESPEIREEMIRNGKERLKLFSWKRTAEATKKTYARALGLL